jgi:hypothetical protein
MGLLSASPWCYTPLTLHFMAAQDALLPRGAPT